MKHTKEALRRQKPTWLILIVLVVLMALWEPTGAQFADFFDIEGTE